MRAKRIGSEKREKTSGGIQFLERINTLQKCADCSWRGRKQLRLRTYSAGLAAMGTRPLLDWTVFGTLMQQAIDGVSISRHLSERNNGIVGETEAVAAVAPLAKGSEAQCHAFGHRGKALSGSSPSGASSNPRTLDALPVVWW